MGGGESGRAGGVTGERKGEGCVGKRWKKSGRGCTLTSTILGSKTIINCTYHICFSDEHESIFMFVFSRLKSSLTCWMTSSVTSVTAHGVPGNSRPFSAPT